MDKNEKSKDSRLNYEKPIHYSKKVLLGNWFEDTSKYVKGNFKRSTTYRDTFTPKPINDKMETEKQFWDNKIYSEESIIPAVKIREDYPNYFDNFTTSYDLSYHCFPLWDCLGKESNIKDTEKYLNSYGNLTKTGLGSFKQEKWQNCDILSPRRASVSTATFCYKKPQPEDYKFKRYGIVKGPFRK